MARAGEELEHLTGLRSFLALWNLGGVWTKIGLMEQAPDWVREVFQTPDVPG